MEKFKLNLSPKTKKIINIVVDVVCGIILAFALILAISMISSKRKNYGNYTEIFGKAYLAVVSDSMEKNIQTGEVGPGNFSKGDLITVDILKNSEKNSLQVGDVITFRDKFIVNGQWKLNTHRIVKIEVNAEGEREYTTRGDNKDMDDMFTKTNEDIVGKLVGRKAGAGKIVSFMSSSAGFFVCVVLPTLIIVAIAAGNLVVVILKEKKVQKATADQAQLDERERIRQELLAEMQVQNQTPTEETKPEEVAVEPATEEKVDEPVADEPAEEQSENTDTETDDKTE